MYILYIYIYICIYTYLHICVFIYIYIYIYICVCVCVYVQLLSGCGIEGASRFGEGFERLRLLQKQLGSLLRGLG